MAASDYITSPQTTGAGPPNLADALYKMIRGIPQAYQEGAEGAYKRGQMARTEALQAPLDVDLDTPEGINAGIQEMIRRGGGDLFEKMVPYLTGVQADRRLAQGPPEGGRAPAPATTHQTPEMLRGQQPPSAASAAPGAASADQAEDTAGPYTLTALVQRSGLVSGDPVRTANMLGAQLGINPKTMLTREQAGQVSAALENQFGERPGVPEAPTSGQTAALGASMPQGVQPQAGTDAPIVPNRVKTVQAPPYQTITPQQAPPAAETPVGTEAQAIQYENRAAARSKWLQAHARNASPGAVKEAEAAIADDRARAKDIRDKLADVAKQMRGQQLDIGKNAAEKEIARGDALAKGIHGSAREFETALKPHLDAMRGILNSPNLVTGSGVEFREALNKIRSNPLFQGLPGYDPNAALPNEAIRKVMASAILNQTTQLKAEAAEMGGSAGRLFQQQISLMEKAAQNPENTKAALRYLTELQQRMGDHMRATSALASDYRGKYGRGALDDGFNEVLSKFNSDAKNQIFHPDEIRDMRLFAPPVAPALHNKADAIKWARDEGIEPGAPIKLPSGRIVAYDPSAFK
jgi:hypothetical protein